MNRQSYRDTTHELARCGMRELQAGAEPQRPAEPQIGTIYNVNEVKTKLETQRTTESRQSRYRHQGWGSWRAS